jgi:hypothetical protein
VRIESQNLRLSSRLAISGSSPLIPVPAGGIANATSFGLFPNSPVLAVQPAQWFRLFSLRASIFADAPNFLNVLNPTMVVQFTNGGTTVTGWSSNPPVVVNPLIFTGVEFGSFETPVFAQTDFAQLLGGPATITLDCFGDVFNSDAAIHNLTVQLSAIVEIYDQWKRT